MINKSTIELDGQIIDIEPVPVAEFEGCLNSFLDLTAAQVQNIVDNWPKDL